MTPEIETALEAVFGFGVIVGAILSALYQQYQGEKENKNL